MFAPTTPMRDPTGEELKTTGHDFSAMLWQVKAGYRARRSGWNSKHQFIFLVPGSHFEVSRPPLEGIFARGTPIDYQPHIDLFTEQCTVVPWLASQGDLLANDWELLP